VALLAEEADPERDEGDTVGKLMTKIRQKLCRHCFAMAQIKTEHDEEYYIFTHVCVKCGQNFVVRIPRDYIDAWETEDKP
jgi:hypothetical protein